jgi:hypothetical protein
VAIIYLRPRLLVTSSDLTRGQRTSNPRAPKRSTLLHGLAPDGVYRGQPITRLPVGSYPTISPLPAETGGMFLWHFP